MSKINGYRVFHNGNPLIVDLKAYSNSRLAIGLKEAGSRAPYMVATVNLPDYKLEEGEVFIKNWSENEGILDSLIKAGIVDMVVGVAPAGHAKAHICKLAPEFKKHIEDNYNVKW